MGHRLNPRPNPKEPAMKTAILSTLALLAIAGPALAAPHSPDPAPHVSVAYGDLDLHNAKDAAAMLKRIQRAAGEACRESPGYVGNDAATVMRLNDCYRRSLARAVAGLDAPKVTEAFAPRVTNKQLARLP
jgi:UrcA family protein